MPPTTLPTRRLLWLVLLPVLAALPFLLGLPGGFLFDDFPTIVHSAAVAEARLDARSLWQAAWAYDPAGGLPRPLVNASFALNAALSGLDPGAFRLTNIALHGANSLLVFALAQRLLLLSGHGPQRALPLALLLALVWALHPLQVSTVLYTVQRMEMACTGFSLLAVLAYLSLRQRMLAGAGLCPWRAGAVVLASALAWTTKENAALVPYLLLAVELLVLRCRAATPLHALWLRRAATLGVVLGGLAALALYGYGLLQPALFAARDFGPLERLAAQSVILPFYLGLILLPRLSAMSFYYDQWSLREWLPIEVAGGLLLLSGLLAAAWLLRRQRPLVALGIAWFLIGHLITSAPLPLELAFEHRNYLPLFGLVLAVVGLLPRGETPLPAKAFAVPLLLLLALAGATALRSAYWSNPVLLARYLVDINPGSARAAMDLGEQYMLGAQNDPHSPLAERAIAEFERAMVMPQGSIIGEHAALLMAAEFGMPQRAEWWQSLSRKLREEPLRPQDVDALVGMVEQRLEGRRLDDLPLLEATLTAARRDLLAPELLLLFATHAAQLPGQRAATVELLARGRRAAAADPEFGLRIDDGIRRLGGEALLREVQAWQPPQATGPVLSPDMPPP